MSAAPASATPEGPAAIIDIGSHSVRLVVLDRLSRAPQQLLTEQMNPDLGRRIAKTGRLDPEGVKMCLDGLQRYAMLCDGLAVKTRIVAATAAVRDARDGADFVRAVKQRTNLDVTILDGAEEGRFSALGVISGMPSANGLVADLGGGSLELVMVDNGRVGARTSLPLGPFRLQQSGKCRTDREKLIAVIDRQLLSVPFLKKAMGHNLYAVGGNWRAIAKAQIASDQYPLNIVHQHELTPAKGIEIAELLSTMPPSSLSRASVSKKRIELVPYAALVMERLLRIARPRSLVFSGYGLREGLVYDHLDAAERARDPLLAGCETIGGSPAYGERVFQWSAPVFAGENTEKTRLRHAACLLSEIAARENAVHRADNAYERALYLPCGGLSHGDRAYLAYALYKRYEGPDDTKPGRAILNTVKRLMPAQAMRAAERVGAVLNFAGAESGCVPQLLDRVSLSILDGRLALTYNVDGAALLAGTMSKQFESLAKGLHLRPVLRQT